jgi:ferredoxin-NADP reductase
LKESCSIEEFNKTLLPNSYSYTIIHRRIRNKDIEDIPDLMARKIFLCGPDDYMNVMNDSLISAGVDTDQILKETFVF